MKIGLIVPGFSASDADWCIPALLKLVRELARRNDVHVFALRYPYRRAAYGVYGATVHALGGGAAKAFARLPLYGNTLRSVLNQHRREPFDLLHGVWADEPGFLAVTAGRLLAVPTAVSVLGGELVGFPDIGYGSQLSPVNRMMVRVALSRAGAVTVGSSYLRRLAESHVPNRRLHQVPLGVDTGFFHPSGICPLEFEGRFKLLHVASLVPIKSQAVLLRALAEIRTAVQGVHLHIVGAGPLRESLEALAQSLGVSSSLTFHGAVPHDRLPAFYQSADLCVMSSRHEGQEWVTQEAAACARSTVGTSVGVVPDLEPATHAVAVGDAPALAHAVTDMARHPSRAKALGEDARVLIEKYYALSCTVDNLQDLYRELASRRSNRAQRRLHRRRLFRGIE